MGTQTMRTATVCGCLLLAVAIYAMDVSSDVNADEVASISEDHVSGLSVLGVKTANPTDCKTVKKTLPSLCAVFGEEHCGAMKAKMLASCKGDISVSCDAVSLQIDSLAAFRCQGRRRASRAH